MDGDYYYRATGLEFQIFKLEKKAARLNAVIELAGQIIATEERMLLDPSFSVFENDKSTIREHIAKEFLEIAIGASDETPSRT